jgi:hypothetical protein
MSDLPREVPGETVWERAVNLAGWLAEIGEQRVVIECAGVRRELMARVSNLPAEIVATAEAGGGTLTAEKAGIRFLMSESAIIRAQ